MTKSSKKSGEAFDKKCLILPTLRVTPAGNTPLKLDRSAHNRKYSIQADHIWE